MPTIVGRINITPVKGTALVHPPSVRLETLGVSGNRRFYLVDEQGALVNGKRAGGLVQLQAHYDTVSHTLAITFADGDEQVARVSLTSERITTNFYGRDVHGRLLCDGWNARLSKVAGFPVRLVQADEATIATDVHPVTLISTATMRWIQEKTKAPAHAWRDRFRMLFEIDGMAPFEEETWRHRRVVIGDAQIKVIDPVPRCVITTQNPHTGVADFKTLHALRELRTAVPHHDAPLADPLPNSGKLMLGMYALVEKTGQVELGSKVYLAESDCITSGDAHASKGQHAH